MVILTTYLALIIFIFAFLLIVFEVFDTSLIALLGALAMVVLRILTPEAAIEAIDFETILLLLAMMILVNIASKSGIFAWLNIKIASLTKGNPLLIFLLFSFFTAIFSAFLDNVTTIILIVPLTIELIQGMGKDPKPYIMAEIIFSNIGGALTLIGDPPNIIMGSAAHFSFLDFILNLWVPILLTAIFTLLVFIILNWKKLRPISDNLVDLCLANLLIKKIKYKFLKITFYKDFVIKVLIALLLTIVGFFFQAQLDLPNYVIAFSATILLAIVSRKRVNIHEAFQSVEWPTLFFFAGLFVMVSGVEHTGILEKLSHWIVNSSSDLFFLSLIILWVSGIISVVLNNIPFITVMIPVITGIQATLAANGVDGSVLWWALSLGACLGGNGTLVGASANVVGVGLAKKNGVKISFLEFMKFSLPLTLGMLVICSVYLFFRIN